MKHLIHSRVLASVAVLYVTGGSWQDPASGELSSLGRSGYRYFSPRGGMKIGKLCFLPLISSISHTLVHIFFIKTF